MNLRDRAKDFFRRLSERLSDFHARRKHSSLPSGAGPTFAERVQGWKLRERLERILPKKLADRLPRTSDPAILVEWVAGAFRRRRASFWGKLVTLALCMFFLADLAALLVDSMIPETPMTAQRGASPFESRSGVPGGARPLDEFNIIISRNLFNSQGLIPGEETQIQDRGGEPVRTSLPFNLIGTVILQNEMRSLATIEDRSASMVYPVRIEDEIPAKAKIVRVEPNRVIFVNLASGRREFIDLPEDASVSNRISISRPTNAAGGPGIEQVSPTQFNISRSEVDKTLSNLNDVLTQARCVPNFKNGMPSGFKCFQIVPGSIYDQLGLKNNDVICGLNGESINDVGKAFETLSSLKTSNHVEICIERDGKQQNYAYEIR